jgi:hypothetical protein
MKELDTEIEVPEFELDLPEIDIPEFEIDIPEFEIDTPEIDLGDMELIEDYSLSIGDSGQGEQPESSLPPSRERS